MTYIQKFYFTIIFQILFCLVFSSTVCARPTNVVISGTSSLSPFSILLQYDSLSVVTTDYGSVGSYDSHVLYTPTVTRSVIEFENKTFGLSDPTA